MNEIKDILSLLKIPSDKISDFCYKSCDGETKIYIELKDIKGVCPHCGSRKIEIKDYYKVKINNSIKISNAIAESTNNTIQTLIDMGYGLPDFERMRKRVLYINRNQKD